MHHCWVSFLSEVNSKTLALPAKGPGCLCTGWALAYFLLRQRQTKVYMREIISTCCQSTLSQQTEAAPRVCIYSIVGKKKRENYRYADDFPLLLCLFLVMLNPPYTLDKCRCLCKQVLFSWTFFSFFSPSPKRSFVPFGHLPFPDSHLRISIPYIFPSKEENEGIDK